MPWHCHDIAMVSSIHRKFISEVQQLMVSSHLACLDSATSTSSQEIWWKGSWFATLWKEQLRWRCALQHLFLGSKFSAGYGSIPINTIFRGMNIHLPAILMFTRGTRFWHTTSWNQRSMAVLWSTESCWHQGTVLDAFQSMTETAGNKVDPCGSRDLFWMTETIGDGSKPIL